MCKISKREINRRSRRAKIVDLASAMFLEDGYAATSMSAIAEQLGGSKATLWAHFSSKEELFGAVVDAKIERFSDQLGEVVMRKPADEDAVRAFCLRFLEVLNTRESSRLFRLIMGEGERFPELGRMFYERAPRRTIALVTDFLKGTYGIEKSGQLAPVLINALLGYRSHVLMQSETFNEQECRDYVDSLLASIAW